MANGWEDQTPVIVGVGETVDHPSDPQHGKEPLVLMAEALRRADEDAGGGFLARLESLDVVNSMTWGYNNLPVELCQSLNIQPQRAVYGAIGGETPILYLHQAAIQIALGKIEVAAVCGAEAAQSLQRAGKANVTLPWTPEGPKPPRPRREGVLHPVVIRNGLISPVVVYPIYEYASRECWGQSFEEGQNESAQLWSQFSAVAAENPYAWSRTFYKPSEISTSSPENRMVAGPYTKRMVANPNVNQGAAIIVTSFSRAKAMGVPENRMAFVWGGSAAWEPRDIAARDQYYRSWAMDTVLTAAKKLAQDNQAEFDLVEFYSCFPCVPKMARRVLGWPADKIPTVTGGLNFFGGPYNNYMSHAAAAMTKRLRGGDESVALLYGQGEFVTKHHAMVVATRPPATPISPEYSVQTEADGQRGPVPALEENFVGQAKLETYTIFYDRHGELEYGVVFARTEKGSRVIGRVDDQDGDTLEHLANPPKQVIGTNGKTQMGKNDFLHWAI